MTKQEEIREGIRKLLAELYCGHGAWIHNDDVTKILSYLHSVGLRLPNGEALIDETNL